MTDEPLADDRTEHRKTLEALELACAIISDAMEDHRVYPHPSSYRQITSAIGRARWALGLPANGQGLEPIDTAAPASTPLPPNSPPE